MGLIGDKNRICKEIYEKLNRCGALQPATNYWRTFELYEVASNDLPEGKGLDVGCGDGLIAEVLFEYIGERELYGVDIDPMEADLARLRKYKEVVVTPASSLPYEDLSFDFVFSNSVLEHIPDVESVIKEISRVMKKGGKFIFTVPNNNFHTLLSGPLVFGRRSRESYFRVVDSRCAHLRYWSELEWKDHLARYGLEVELCKSYLNKKNLRVWENMARFTSGIFYSVMGERFRPIEIQRIIGSRGAASSRWASSMVARVLSSIFRGDPLDAGSDDQKSCFIICATKVL